MKKLPDNEYEEIVVIKHNKRLELICLTIRNVCVILAFLLFMASIFGAPNPYLHKAVAYFFGVGAYFCELIIMTGGFKNNIPTYEKFMAYVFTPMYLILGFSYLIEHFTELIE